MNKYLFLFSLLLNLAVHGADSTAVKKDTLSPADSLPADSAVTVPDSTSGSSVTDSTDSSSLLTDSSTVDSGDTVKRGKAEEEKTDTLQGKHSIGLSLGWAFYQAPQIKALIQDVRDTMKNTYNGSAISLPGEEFEDLNNSFPPGLFYEFRLGRNYRLCAAVHYISSLQLNRYVDSTQFRDSTRLSADTGEFMDSSLYFREITDEFSFRLVPVDIGLHVAVPKDILLLDKYNQLYFGFGFTAVPYFRLYVNRTLLSRRSANSLGFGYHLTIGARRFITQSFIICGEFSLRKMYMQNFKEHNGSDFYTSEIYLKYERDEKITFDLQDAKFLLKFCYTFSPEMVVRKEPVKGEKTPEGEDKK
jgi:hypothetical protein